MLPPSTHLLLGSVLESRPAVVKWFLCAFLHTLLSDGMRLEEILSGGGAGWGRSISGVNVTGQRTLKSLIGLSHTYMGGLRMGLTRKGRPRSWPPGYQSGCTLAQLWLLPVGILQKPTPSLAHREAMEQGA